MDLPLRGTLSAVVDVSGTVQGAGTTPSTRGVFALIPRDGTVEIATDALQWRGRNLGTLRADLSLSDGIAQISDLALYRAAVPVPPASASGEGEAAVNETPAPATPPAKPLSIVRVVGQVPLSADAPGLDATLSVDNERLSLVREALQEIQLALKERDIRVTNFEQVVTRLRALPTELEGSLGLQAKLSGSWSDPTVAVDFNVRNPRVGSQTLPTVSAAFTFGDGAITIRDLALRQTFPAVDDDDERETVLRVAEGGRIEPDGTISLDGEVLNANLSQLALWLPDLREMSGRPLLRGELSLFTFQVRGTTQSPEWSVQSKRKICCIATIRSTACVSRASNRGRAVANRAGQPNHRQRRFSVVGGMGTSAMDMGRKRRGARNLVVMRPLQVHFPLETRDFGALAGAFVPALANVDADDVSRHY
jgi:hypothetical protein